MKMFMTIRFIVRILAEFIRYHEVNRYFLPSKASRGLLE